MKRAFLGLLMLLTGCVQLPDKHDLPDWPGHSSPTSTGKRARSVLTAEQINEQNARRMAQELFDEIEADE